MTYKTIGQRVLVKLLPIEEKNKIISTDEESVVCGEVITVPPVPIDLSSTHVMFGDLVVGNKVWFYDRVSHHLPFDEELRVIDKDDILVVE